MPTPHNIVTFMQDIGVARHQVESLLSTFDLTADWSLADGHPCPVPEHVFALCTVNTPLTQTELTPFKNLQHISVSFTGFNHIDLAYCQQHDIKVCNVPGYATDSVAELALGLTFSLLRQIPTAHRSTVAGHWQGTLPPGTELSGQTCGIIGTGAIGTRLAQILSAFGCPLLCTSRTPRPALLDLGATYVPQPQLLRQSDIIFLTTALTPQTHHLIDAESFRLMRPTALLINVARGPIIDTPALISALASGQIAGAGLDVYASEPLTASDPLLSVTDKLVLTPHIAYRTQQALDRKAKTTIENIGRHFTSQPLLHEVKPPKK